MTEYTAHYRLLKLAMDQLSTDSFKFSQADRDLIDTLLYMGVEGHHHTGGGSGVSAGVGPILTLDVTTGAIPASQRVYYRYTFVDGSGIETAPSAVSYLDTSSAVVAPAAGTLVTSSTGGTLPPGNYFYVLSAYQTFDTLETTADNPVYISVPYTTSTNSITLTLPILPSGATGFNVYRRGPSNVGYRYLTSVNMSVATPPTTFFDNGSYVEDPDRPLPTANTTESQNSIEVTLPGATPALPGIGYLWRIYRSYSTSDWTNSLLVTTTSLSYVDIGTSTSVGQPPISGISVGNPAKVQLSGAAEVQGFLPTANIANFTSVVQALVSALLIAANVSYAGNTDLQSANVEAALDELDIEKLSRFGGVRHGQVTAGNAGAAATIDLSYGNVIRYTLNSATATFTFPTVSAAGAGATPTVFAHEFWLVLTQDSSGSRSVTWPTKVKWGASGAPTLSTGAGKVDVFRFMSPDLGTTWYGNVWGLGF